MGDDILTYTVSQLNSYVKSMIDSDPCLTYIYVVGEISNFTNHYKTGHFYLTLKDEKAAIKAVMFRSNASRIIFEPQNGMKVICRGRASLFERDGCFQFYIDDMQPDGAGALQVAFEQLVEKLKSEGLFDESHKKPIPKYPEKIAVITSPTGAAVQDIKNVISRRYPCVELIMCPVLVQGDGAAEQLSHAVETVNELKCADVIIIGRGGGSIEDLWAFNEESVARAIVASKIPIISCVGHEIDFTIADFVADLRAPTPSAAAELAVPVWEDLNASLTDLKLRLSHALMRGQAVRHADLKRLSESAVLSMPQKMLLSPRKEQLEHLSNQLENAVFQRCDMAKKRLETLSGMLQTLNPESVLGRGYAIISRQGKITTNVSTFVPECEFDVRLADGTISAKALEIKLRIDENGKEKTDL